MRVNLGNYLLPDDVGNEICFDIGGNLGDFTEKYISKFNKIYIIEPQIILYENIIKRFKKNKNVIPLNFAVWSESNLILELVSHSNLDSGSVGVKSELLNSDWTNEVLNKVSSISLYEIYNIVNDKNIDYIKIDCETSEYNMLINKDLSKLRYIGIELHSQMGIDRYNELINWIKNTHMLIYGDDTYRFNYNQEVLYKIK